MRVAPKIPWPYRAAALTAALLIGLYFLRIYVAGVQFAGMVGHLYRPAAAEAPPAPSEPGVVSVKIIGEKKN
jgi:hypothetical protein